VRKETGTERTEVPDAAVWGACLFFVCCCAFRLARFNVTDIHAPKVLVESATAEPLPAAGGAGAAAPASPRAASLRQRIGRNVARKVAGTRASQRGLELIRTYVNRKKFFQGVPAPMGGSMALTPMVVSFVWPHATWPVEARAVAVAVLGVVGALMVSTLPTLSSKMLMRNPSTESHLKSRNAYSLLFKLTLVVAFCATAILFRWQVYLGAIALYVVLLPAGSVVYALCEA
jgi:phosphatidylserine synthase